jgi:predicted permease
MIVIMLIGTLFSLKEKVTNRTKRLLGSIIVNIAIPCIILEGIIALEVNVSTLKNLLSVFVFSILMSCFGICFGWIISRVTKRNEDEARNVAILGGLGNTGFLGITLSAVILGPIAGLYAAIFDIGVTIVIFSVVVFMLRRQEGFSFLQLKVALLNIPMLVIVLGIAVKMTHIKLPDFVISVNGNLADLALPLGMLYVGILIPPTIKTLQLWKRKYYLLLAVFVKLIAFPCIVFVILYHLNLPALTKHVLMLQFAAPTFILAPILFSRFAKNHEVDAIVITIGSTILGMATMPIIIFLAIQMF